MLSPAGKPLVADVQGQMPSQGSLGRLCVQCQPFSRSRRVTAFAVEEIFDTG
jgi:hypothetical protein